MTKMGSNTKTWDLIYIQNKMTEKLNVIEMK